MDPAQADSPHEEDSASKRVPAAEVLNEISDDFAI